MLNYNSAFIFGNWAPDYLGVHHGKLREPILKVNLLTSFNCI